MIIKDQEVWDLWVKNNQDGYGAAIIRYAELWGDFMESRITETNCTVADVAKQASIDADIDGITGYMYSAAIRVLETSWIFGEELREWYTKDRGY